MVFSVFVIFLWSKPWPYWGSNIVRQFKILSNTHWISAGVVWWNANRRSHCATSLCHVLYPFTRHCPQRLETWKSLILRWHSWLKNYGGRFWTQWLGQNFRRWYKSYMWNTWIYGPGGTAKVPVFYCLMKKFKSIIFYPKLFCCDFQQISMNLVKIGQNKWKKFLVKN